MNWFDIMDTFDFRSVVAEGDEAVVKYFQEHNLIQKGADCLPCGRQFSMIKNKGSSVGYMLRCPGCRRKDSLTRGTLFDGSHLALSKLLGLMYYWASQRSIAQTTDLLSVSSHTVVQWYQYFREICSWKLSTVPDFPARPEHYTLSDEQIWREYFGHTPQLALMNLERHIAERYPLHVVRTKTWCRQHHIFITIGYFAGLH